MASVASEPSAYGGLPDQPAALYRPTDVAQALKLSKRELYHQIEKGALPAVRLWPGGPLRIESAAVQAYEAAARVALPAADRGVFYLASSGLVLIAAATNRLRPVIARTLRGLPLPGCLVALDLDDDVRGRLLSARQQFARLRVRGEWYRVDGALWSHLSDRQVFPPAFEPLTRVQLDTCSQTLLSN